MFQTKVAVSIDIVIQYLIHLWYCDSYSRERGPKVMWTAFSDTWSTK